MPHFITRQIFTGAGKVGTEAAGRIIDCSADFRLADPAVPVRDNLLLGAYLRRDDAQVKRDLDYVFTLFPILEERWRQERIADNAQ